MHSISTAQLKKALSALERALTQPKNEFTRGAAIQSFEYSFELSWKLLKRYFEFNQGLKELAVKDLFREAAKQGLIADPLRWFEYQKSRNLTSHTYNEDTADIVYEEAKRFLEDAKALLASVEVRLA